MNHSKQRREKEGSPEKITSHVIFRITMIAVFLGTAFLVFSGRLSCTDGFGAKTYAGEVQTEQVLVRSFGIEGDLMCQLLKGFGSELVAEDLLDLKLNCESKVLREELIGDVAVIDVELVCECVDPDREIFDLTGFSGKWRLVIER